MFPMRIRIALTMVCLLVPVVVQATGCRNRSTTSGEPSPTASGMPVASAAAPSSAVAAVVATTSSADTPTTAQASASPPLPEAEPPLPKDLDQSVLPSEVERLKRVQQLGCAKDARNSLAKGRQHAGRKQWASAVLVYDRGVRREPGNAELRGERGYALLQLGAFGYARSDFMAGLSLTKDRRLLSMLHFNLGLAYEREQNPAAASRHFRSAAALGNQAAASRLPTGSVCPADVDRTPPNEPAPVVESLQALWEKRLPGCDKPSAHSEQEAAALLCRDCNGNSWDEDACKLSFPLRVVDTANTQSPSEFLAEAFKVDGRTMYSYGHASVGGWTTAGQPENEETLSIAGHFLVSHRPEHSNAALADGLGSILTDEAGPGYRITNRDSPPQQDSTCKPLRPNPLESVVFDLHDPYAERQYAYQDSSLVKTKVWDLRKRRLTYIVTTWDDAVQVKLHDGKLRIIGGGCNEPLGN